MNPVVTVLLSVRNGLPYLPEAVASVLAQTFADFEFIILDDASTDGTADYLRSVSNARVRVISLAENIGLTAALNVGLREARGEFIARHDADDLSHPQRLREQVAFLRANPACAVVGSQARLVDVRGRSLGKKNFPLSHRSICFAHLFDNAFAHSAVTFRRASVGAYDEAWAASQDYELWSRVSERYALANLPQRLVTLRVLESSITSQHKRPELIRRVQAAHYHRLFARAASEAELDLIGLFRTCVAPERLGDFRALLTELCASTYATWPETDGASDFRRTLAMMHERIGYNLLTTSRGVGLSEIRRAVATWPPSLLGLPWLRIGALVVFGDGARAWYGRLAK